MATDFYPTTPIPFDRFLAVIQAEPRLHVVHEVVREVVRDQVTIERPRGNFVHALRMDDGTTVVTRYGHNDPERILVVLDALFGVRFGPEHERDPPA